MVGNGGLTESGEFCQLVDAQRRTSGVRNFGEQFEPYWISEDFEKFCIDCRIAVADFACVERTTLTGSRCEGKQFWSGHRFILTHAFHIDLHQYEEYPYIDKYLYEGFLMDAPQPAKLSFLDRFLPLWIILAMALGLIIGQVFPQMSHWLDALKVGSVSLPIALGLLVMMYPPLAKVRYDKATKIASDKRLMTVSLLLNWVAGPLFMFALAWIFLPDQPELRTGLIIVGLARCIAMVLVWSDLSCGDSEATAVLVAINSVFQVLMFGVLGWFYLQILPSWLGLATTSAEFSFWAIVASVLVFLGIPLALGVLSRTLGEKLKGRDWYQQVYLPRISPLALLGLLYTIVLLFALQGHQIMQQPWAVARVALPLLIYFGCMFVIALFTSRASGMNYAQSASVAFTATGNNFELAIAVAIGTFGVFSGQALAGTIGPLVEVPALISLVYFLRWVGPKLFAGDPTLPASSTR